MTQKTITMFLISSMLGICFIDYSHAGRKERKVRREKRKDNRKIKRTFWRKHKDICLGNIRNRNANKILNNRNNLLYCCQKLRGRLIAKGIGVVLE